MAKKWLRRSGLAALVVGGLVLVNGAIADPPKDPGGDSGICRGLEHALAHANSDNAKEKLCDLARDNGCGLAYKRYCGIIKPPPK